MLSSSVHISPDPTLTVESVLEVMGEVQNWWKLGEMLSVPESKLQVIETQLSTEKKNISMGHYWVNNDPHASWEKLCSTLYMMKEERAVAKAIQYLPKGNSILLILLYGVCILIKNTV